MKKHLILAVILVFSYSASAQPNDINTSQSQRAQPLKPLMIVLLKSTDPVASPKSAETEVNLPRPTQSVGAPAMVKQVPSDAALRLPIPLAVKVLAQNLPGIGVMPGDVADMRIKSVRVGTDRNELVYIALSQLNKIATPFDSPQAIDATGATLKAVGQDLYIQPSSDKPLTVYITNGGVGQSIGLTLVPKANLPAQTVVLQPDSPAGSPAVKAEAEEIVAGDYVARITSIVKQLALQKTPSGFTRSRLPRSMVAGSGLAIEPLYKYAGSAYDLFTYKVRSTSSSPLELKEDAFYTEAVRAVAFYPSALLQSDEETTVFVIADRPFKEAGQ
jgi:conjugal transfer pilus assembly protein TraK